jgi:hypothetical protein
LIEKEVAILKSAKEWDLGVSLSGKFLERSDKFKPRADNNIFYEVYSGSKKVLSLIW